MKSLSANHGSVLHMDMVQSSRMTCHLHLRAYQHIACGTAIQGLLPSIRPYRVKHLQGQPVCMSQQGMLEISSIDVCSTCSQSYLSPAPPPALPPFCPLLSPFPKCKRTPFSTCTAHMSSHVVPKDQEQQGNADGIVCKGPLVREPWKLLAVWIDLHSEGRCMTRRVPVSPDNVALLCSVQHQRCKGHHKCHCQCLPVSAKNARLPMKPAKKELKGKEPTSNM